MGAVGEASFCSEAPLDRAYSRQAQGPTTVTVPEQLQGVLVATPDTLHGAVRFAGTRVFAQSLFDYLMNGEPLEIFLDHFPDVTREQAEAVLDWEQKRLKREFGFELSA